VRFLHFSRKHQDRFVPIFFQVLRENTNLFIITCIEKQCTRPLKQESFYGFENIHASSKATYFHASISFVFYLMWSLRKF